MKKSDVSPYSFVVFIQKKKKGKIIVIFLNNCKFFFPTNLLKFCKSMGKYLPHVISLNV